ncbi:hypothetical protein KC573_02145, partial [candidate division WWE3 bacterium]|nr:hypothetical protein [candidate division WWE3 bacterium]
MAIFTAMQFSARMIADSSARLSAMSLINERMESFRSLSYDDVGTLSGFPTGVIPQSSTTTLNGIEFVERVLVDYINDPADDVAGVDSNGIITDYKQLKIEISWSAHGRSNSISYVSNIVPVSIETDQDGGAVNVEVSDADGSPLSGATVRVVNNSLVPNIDITRTTGPTGLAQFSVPAGSGYHASATMANYSADKTYEATGGNPNPSPGSFTVVKALISTQGFQIGELSDMEISTFSSITSASSTVSFSDSSDLASSTDVTIDTGALRLKDTLGVYESTGLAVMHQIEPAAIDEWGKVVVIGSAPAGSDYRVQFFTGTTSSYQLVDETDLPGNAAGFNDDIIDLSHLDVSSYPDLTVEIILTGDTTVTPTIDDLAVYYRVSDVVRSNVDIDVISKKTIGDSPDIYKYDASLNTGGGVVSLNSMEFDEYTVTNTDGLTLVHACANTSLSLNTNDVTIDHQAGIDSELELVYGFASTHNLWVVVEDTLGETLTGEIITLERTGYTDS